MLPVPLDSRHNDRCSSEIAGEQRAVECSQPSVVVEVAKEKARKAVVLGDGHGSLFRGRIAKLQPVAA